VSEAQKMLNGLFTFLASHLLIIYGMGVVHACLRSMTKVVVAVPVKISFSVFFSMVGGKILHLKRI